MKIDCSSDRSEFESFRSEDDSSTDTVIDIRVDDVSQQTIQQSSSNSWQAAQERSDFSHTQRTVTHQSQQNSDFKLFVYCFFGMFACVFCVLLLGAIAEEESL